MSLHLVPADIGPAEEELKELILELDGDLTAAAKRLKADSMELRRRVFASEALTAVFRETMERGADAAVSVLFEGLRDEGSYQNRFYAAKAFLNSEVGRKRGFGAREPAGASIEAKSSPDGTRTLTLRWLTPEGE